MSDYEARKQQAFAYIETCSLEEAKHFLAIVKARSKELSGVELSPEDIKILADVDKKIAEASR